MLKIAKIPKFYVPNKFSLGGGEFQGQKSWKHDFEITGDPKCPPGGSTFGRVLRPLWGNALCQDPKNRKLQIRPKTEIFQYQSIDDSLLSSHKNF